MFLFTCKISVHRSNIVVAVDIRYIGGSGEHDTGYSQEEDYFMERPPSEWLTRLQVAHHPFDLSVMNFVPALISLTISTVVISSVLNVPSIVDWRYSYSKGTMKLGDLPPLPTRKW